jgi:predicted  nucleic acid-binding Zn-ribbon protein
MNIPNPSPFLRSFYTIQERLDGLEENRQEIRQELAALRSSLTDLSQKVAILETRMEQTQKTFEAQMRAVVAETVADMRVQYAEWKAENRPPERSSKQLPPTEQEE